MMSVDGTSGEGEWSGTIDTTLLPASFNPSGGYHHLVEQPDRSPVARADHARLGGAVPRDASARSC